MPIGEKVRFAADKKRKHHVDMVIFLSILPYKEYHPELLVASETSSPHARETLVKVTLMPKLHKSET